MLFESPMLKLTAFIYSYAYVVNPSISPLSKVTAHWSDWVKLQQTRQLSWSLHGELKSIYNTIQRHIRLNNLYLAKMKCFMCKM